MPTSTAIAHLNSAVAVICCQLLSFAVICCSHHMQAYTHRCVCPDTAAHCLCQCIRLLVDLFLHVMLVTTLVREGEIGFRV